MLDPQTGADKTVHVAWDSALVLNTVRKRPRPCGYWLADHTGYHPWRTGLSMVVLGVVLLAVTIALGG